MAEVSERDALKRQIREKYAAAAKTAAGRGNCCSGGSAISGGLYAPDEADMLPAEALTASLGCGNPTALANLRPGEVVLDLGSGAGADVLLSARRVGPSGRVYGLDMTDEMLELARANAARAGATNVQFLKGEIEAIPLPDAHVDVIISNCVINLSTNKDAVLAEAFRVLKPGGRLAISDIVIRDGFDLPPDVRSSVEAWAGCVAGALSEGAYKAKLAAAGFASPEVEITAVYGGDACCQKGEAAGALASAFIRARKPD